MTTTEQKTLSEIRDEFLNSYRGTDSIDIAEEAFDAGVAEMQKRAQVLVDAIDIATALLIVPEHLQYEAWYENEKLVNKALPEYRKGLGEE